MRTSNIPPSEIQKRLASWQYVAQAIIAGLDGKPFDWTGGEFDSYKHKVAAMGITLITKSQVQKQGYRIKNGAKPVGSGYFKAPISRSADLYVLECQCVKAKVVLAASIKSVSLYFRPASDVAFGR